MTKPADDLEDADPALARERSDLAWTRTAISFAALGVSILRSRPAAAVPVLLFSAVIWRLGRMPRTGQSRAAARRVLLTTIAITVMAVAALAIALLS